MNFLLPLGGASMGALTGLYISSALYHLYLRHIYPLCPTTTKGAVLDLSYQERSSWYDPVLCPASIPRTEVLPCPFYGQRPHVLTR